MKKTERDKVEGLLLTNFPGIVHPLKEDDIPEIEKFKDGSFGFSYLGMMLYANGRNEKGKSTLHPQGLIYNDSENIFAIGFFKKNLQEKSCHLHIIAPRGKTWFIAIENFIKKCRMIENFPKTSVFVRHLSESQYKKMLDLGYKPISFDPWHLVAPSEDETYNHRLIKIDDIIGYDSDEHLFVKPLNADGNRDFRRKALMAYNRFLNFLERNDLRFSTEEFNPEIHMDIARGMVVDHFRTLENAIGSTPQDYFNLIEYMPKENENFIKYISFLIGGGEKIPVSLFLGEKIGKETVALYATFALRNEIEIREKFNPTGYSAISQYSYIKMFDLLNKGGYKYVDLGGSEVESLNTFKRQLGANEKMTYWVVKK